MGIDWSITVPLQMIEFNLILKAAKAPISSGGFWKLLIGTVLMLTFGYIGETTPGFGWPGLIQGFRRGQRSCEEVLRQHAPHRERRLEHLPSRLLLGLLDRHCRPDHPQRC